MFLWRRIIHVQLICCWKHLVNFESMFQCFVEWLTEAFLDGFVSYCQYLMQPVSAKFHHQQAKQSNHAHKANKTATINDAIIITKFQPFNESFNKILNHFLGWNNRKRTQQQQNLLFSFFSLSFFRLFCNGMSQANKNKFIHNHLIQFKCATIF